MAEEVQSVPQRVLRARERAKKWHWNNHERAKAASRKWASENRQAARERTLKWRKDNPERARENDARKRANKSPEYLRKRCIDEQNRRARIRAVGGKLSRGLAERLFQEQKGKCRSCSADLSLAFELDHIIPLALNGPNMDENIQLLCPPCNRRKGAKLL